MKKISLMMILSSAMSFAQEQTVNEQVKDGFNTAKTIVTEAKSLKEELKVTKPTFTETKKSSNFLDTTSNGIGTVYGDTKNGVSTLYNDVKSLSPDAKSAIQEIYSEIKKISTYTWNLFVRQQWVWAWCYLLGELLFFYTVFRFWKAYDKYTSDVDNTGTTKNKNIFPFLILGAASLILGYFSFIHFEAMMTGFFNPEFGALRNIIDYSKILK